MLEQVHRTGYELEIASRAILNQAFRSIFRNTDEISRVANRIKHWGGRHHARNTSKRYPLSMHWLCHLHLVHGAFLLFDVVITWRQWADEGSDPDNRSNTVLLYICSRGKWKTLGSWCEDFIFFDVRYNTKCSNGWRQPIKGTIYWYYYESACLIPNLLSTFPRFYLSRNIVLLHNRYYKTGSQWFRFGREKNGALPLPNRSRIGERNGW